MTSFRSASAVFLGAFTTLALACGSDGSSRATFDEGANDGGDRATGNGGGTFGPGSSNDGDVTPKPSTTDPKCAAVNVAATQLPVYLVFMYDRSGSMKYKPDNSVPQVVGPNGGPPPVSEQSKWELCKSGMNAFFADPKSKGISVSLGLFPSVAGDKCEETTYATPAVALRALPDATELPGVLNAVSPNGGTPTLPAVRAALTYAKKVRETHASKDGGKVAVVLVTDGKPEGCSDNNVSRIAAAVAEDKALVPTYVIGIGFLSNLNEIAKAGGTQQAYVISSTSPAQTSAEFQAALTAIRGAQLSCEYQMPAAPAGKTLDLATVNVVYTKGDGSKDALSYDKDCAASGWRYDNADAPSKILLCGSTCDMVKADPSPKVDVELGCATKGTNGSIPR